MESMEDPDTHDINLATSVVHMNRQFEAIKIIQTSEDNETEVKSPEQTIEEEKAAAVKKAAEDEAAADKKAAEDKAAADKKAAEDQPATDYWGIVVRKMQADLKE